MDVQNGMEDNERTSLLPPPENDKTFDMVSNEFVDPGEDVFSPL